MRECPRCNGQGNIYKGKIKQNIMMHICDECDACWEIDDEIRYNNFHDLTTYLMQKGIAYNQDEIEDLGYLN